MKSKETKGLEQLKKAFGKRLDIHVFNSSDNDNLLWHYSPTLPKLTIKRNNITYNVEVTTYSAEIEDKRLLHHLLVKTREQTKL